MGQREGVERGLQQVDATWRGGTARFINHSIAFDCISNPCLLPFTPLSHTQPWPDTHCSPALAACGWWTLLRGGALHQTLLHNPHCLAGPCSPASLTLTLKPFAAALLARRWVVDATRKGGAARFISHSRSARPHHAPLPAPDALLIPKT